ncbi:MAG: DUF2804 domain-containing protein [Oscillospiraceae bacterium]|nr:DUF2804 domain-containing protein [Oscillospiraceae bacterium]
MTEQVKYDEREITVPVNICTDSGELNRDSIGWSRMPLHNCNLSGRWPRKKKWNYWYTMNSECLFSATISSLDYAGMVFVYFLDLKTMKFIEKNITVPFAKGCNIPVNTGGAVSFRSAAMEVSFLDENGGTHIIVKSKDFGGCSLDADILVSPPEDNETLNVVIPWNERTFQFTSKQAALPTSGTLRVGDFKYDFRPDSTFSGLDFGRGIWPRKVSWNWGTASGAVNGRRVGLNLGAKWTDGTGMTENALYVDGKLTKISEDVVYEYDLKNIMNPWKIKSTVSDCVDLIFTPLYERVAATNMLLVKSDMHQMIGYFSGHIVTSEGERIEFDRLNGCAEEHNTVW